VHRHGQYIYISGHFFYLYILFIFALWKKEKIIRMENLINKHKSCSSHCCILHGCKYGHEDCPVCLGVVKQGYLCEYCKDFIFNEAQSIEKMKIKINKAFFKKNRKLKIDIINKNKTL